MYEIRNPLTHLSPEGRGMRRGVVLVIWNWRFEFVWDLGFVIWDFRPYLVNSGENGYGLI